MLLLPPGVTRSAQTKPVLAAANAPSTCWKTKHKDTFSATNAWQHEDQELAVVPLAGKDYKGLS